VQAMDVVRLKIVIHQQILESTYAIATSRLSSRPELYSHRAPAQESGGGTKHPRLIPHYPRFPEYGGNSR
jgi:hypothetical protein